MDNKDLLKALERIFPLAIGYYEAMGYDPFKDNDVVFANNILAKSHKEIDNQVFREVK